MKTHLIFWTCLLLTVPAFAGPEDSLYLVALVKEAKLELAETKADIQLRADGLRQQWIDLERYCAQAEADAMQCWRKQRDLEWEWQLLQQEEHLRLLQVRYRKGIDLIKLLYEKILALDHHFSSMNTYQNILLMANPNNYPGFQQIRNVLEERLRKRNALTLPGILQSNTYLSATFSLVASLLGDGEQNAKQEDLERISCILDFTVRMRSDLSVVQHETEYLKLANQQLKLACERLFEDYVQVIGYLVPLDRCRMNDDWESLYLQLDGYVRELQEELQTGTLPDLPVSGINRRLVNLEFATQRVAEFIGKYNDFINLGTQYYQKFDNIVSTYENEERCSSDLPYQFGELQSDISGTIDKFNNTYRLPEIQGSRMKDLLYGLSD